MAKPMYYWNGTTWEAVAPVVPQSPIAYQASAPSTPSTGDLWIDSDQDLDSYQRQLVRYRFNPSAGATSVSGVDANGATLSYTPGAEQVYLNGALLVRGSDYVATNGTSITSLAALSSGDVLEVFAYVAFNPANTYTQSQVDGLVGLVHLKTETFSATSTVSVNDVFSATYDNYKIFANLSNSSAQSCRFRLRASGTDLTGSVYTTQALFASGASITSARAATTTSLELGSVRSVGTAIFEVLIGNPFASQVTTTKSQADNFIADSITTPGVDFYFSTVNNTNSYTGFTIFPASGNLTGNISVFGIKE